MKQKLRLLEHEWYRRGQLRLQGNIDTLSCILVILVLPARSGRLLFHVDLTKSLDSTVSRSEEMPRFEVNGYSIGAPIVDAHGDNSLLRSEENISPIPFESIFATDSSSSLSQLDSMSYAETGDDEILAAYDAFYDSFEESDTEESSVSSSDI
ncbi:hypothetical protein BDN72DRAFT_964340 [Pluteus cervinus]|uniref:Uncharacterized protein n=1 Tax=Pluteus cervinus TaxID=181527 RepID=A0ACD3ABF4_9AGAR|nr:hypothetical protein BDN72DRAFT_964340 [Pluteus cervinus]